MSRRSFLAQSSALCSATLLPWARESTAAGLETTKIRLMHAPAICLAPQYLAEEFLRVEGFKTVEYARNENAWPAQDVEAGRADFTQDAVQTLIPSIEAGSPLVALAGIHVGCYELFARDPIRHISELRGKRIAIPYYGGPNHLLTAIMLAYIGIDPVKGVEWVIGPTGSDGLQIYLDGKADAYLTFPPQGHTLREMRAGNLIVNTSTDRPWSQYFCCLVVAHREFVARHPVATKRALRAFLRATDFCHNQPEQAAQMLVKRGFEPRLDVAMDTLKGLTFSRWRETGPEDTLRFHALRLREAGMIKSTPDKIVASGMDLRFLNELRKELKS